MNHNEATRAVVTVGDGRGFVVECSDQRYVITAAHCLPHLPRACSFDFSERTYFPLLARLGEKPTIAAECCFVDPFSDIAVLTSPDDQALSDAARHYEKWIEALAPLPVADARENEPAWLLSLSGLWFKCTVEHFGGELWVSHAVEGIVGGMSGSPILADDGLAIGVVCNSGGSPGKAHTEGGPNPRLAYNLPARFLSENRRPSPAGKLSR
jgi:hypothetical protein